MTAGLLRASYAAVTLHRGMCFAFFSFSIADYWLTMSFQLVCLCCDSVGIAIDDPELTPSSAMVRCSRCQANRGTLGELRRLAASQHREPFDQPLPSRT
ncbi:hypothetical protein [Bradyrhizobium guangzhouense]|uniref:hypothetical protein n=1 Tax=Bradyrhizobium guangzhouense TaxID=1325095 RepID=UPI001009A1B4|nr:hypothetical protein [Bradyrhizobium guangzhouense]